ncbi:GntR family transcriptional regulator [Variovorax sp. NFACC27]|uniref:GntR family transcriptional regulator n=1 Tax=unclassified Variovorax TaxID=663243 RepID=UPI000899A0FA|nr:DNA-binding transcriptional regulator, GntR family [Variovorax sp. NFACC28]SEG98188.1 DNA-binding transcriptional regulator, GntR family [Variovorax sp. NFACC29]SFE05437.1 DNA-binding transcriptional regulator, GntR family [Variovorax sp. NFACC26]SFH13292.1 DNA-binding transcriptional regulator, GntR family [Variovorax sp. NFACC27]
MLPTLDIADESLPLQERLFEDIKRRIITCELLPGAEVSESSVSTAYGISKAPVRSALSRLKEAGWLQSLPRRSHVVTPLKISDVNEIYDARALIEPETARLAAGNVSRSYLLALDGACARAYDLDDANAKREFLLANAAFHVGIAKACGNARLCNILAQLHEESLRVLYLSVSVAQRSKSWKTGHQLMIEMLLHGDGVGAAKETREGIERSRAAVLDALARQKHLLKSGS